MRVTEARDLLRHMEWADAATWRALLALPGLRGGRDLLERVYHLHAVQRAYLHIWRREPLAIPEPAAFADLAAVRDWARAYYRALPPYLDGLNDAEMERAVEFPWAEHVAERFGSAGPATLGESILQIVLHSTHHRGQITSTIRSLGGDPATTDLMAWLWMNRPEPGWEG
jgi:uncharacterized damage-inducible protein DinB